jgi:putative transcriptional regulator
MKDSDFNKLVEGIKQVGQIKHGHRKPSRVFKYDILNVRSIRAKLQVTQTDFALMLGVSSKTLQNWEQGRREPEGPAKALLTIADRNPKALLAALHAQ